MKYWILGLSLMVMACSHSVDVKDQASYKCGDQIIRVTVLNDNSMIVRANGIDHVPVSYTHLTLPTTPYV